MLLLLTRYIRNTLLRFVLNFKFCGKGTSYIPNRWTAIGGAYPAMLRSQLSAPDVCPTALARTLGAIATVNGCQHCIADIECSPKFTVASAPDTLKMRFAFFMSLRLNACNARAVSGNLHHTYYT